ncbi:MAG: hypothetical protein DI551_07345 [Micavibrio aeruginosavorus]|uniref:Lipocalin-like domain-containing protein n=1 Tax=Micavibrio aeruginosavorus TaxID=349221 RepID=A0A2W5MVV2_9BACT|nr:MAG: hypothetical protein DI551_07345 [Micavibrio aeruginosavorus]
MPHPLDGKYLVTSTTDYNGPLEKKSDGETEIRDGQTRRYDRANCLWTSQFKILNETQVEMTSIADPVNADIDFLLTRPDGSPTRDAVTYKTVLKLARKDDKIQMSGQISYGGDLTFLTMRKTGPLS